MAKYTKAIMALVTSGGLANALVHLGLPEDVSGTMVALLAGGIPALTTLAVYFFKNDAV